MSCPQEALAALVDGALSHDERERVHAHLAGCAGCRAEVEAQRSLKARLAGLEAVAPPADLVARLQRLAVPGVEPALPRPLPLPVGSTLPGSRGPADRRPPGVPVSGGRRRSVRRTRVVGGSVVLLGVVGLALVLGAPAATAPSTPVDPGSDAFVVDFVSTTSEVPLADPAGRAALLPAP